MLIMTSAIQIKRLKVLIRELKELRANTDRPKFSMGQWMSNFLSKRMTRKALHQDIMDATRQPCGTAACLAGKAGLIPAIRRMGFKWDVLSAEDAPFDVIGRAHAGFQYDGYTGDYAVKSFFGQEAFHEVFMAIGEISTLLQGIKALEEIVKQEEKALAETETVDFA